MQKNRKNEKKWDRPLAIYLRDEKRRAASRDSQNPSSLPRTLHCIYRHLKKGGDERPIDTLVVPLYRDGTLKLTCSRAFVGLLRNILRLRLVIGLRSNVIRIVCRPEPFMMKGEEVESCWMCPHVFLRGTQKLRKEKKKNLSKLLSFTEKNMRHI